MQVVWTRQRSQEDISSAISQLIKAEIQKIQQVWEIHTAQAGNTSKYEKSTVNQILQTMITSWAQVIQAALGVLCIQTDSELLLLSTIFSIISKGRVVKKTATETGKHKRTQHCHISHVAKSQHIRQTREEWFPKKNTPKKVQHS